ncbi:Molecular chaperone IbpA, HSP20 family [Butyrivibrio hungatei DSM 14810]|uniref:Molecular chaperone IbpA, HSP20 family n=1 Tax=Butyrivibrio hungatei DSM 14810 TaxID=1121132 RepID=A0A1M7SEH5_9FIRM|nr:Hsp20/alpha crystallin family protein [Butyrivibrio hungatei]SHN56863.1 Molecular chaperone IbpA, HSP20 family [Butyrivibrio hungatei DSM 14810]
MLMPMIWSNNDIFDEMDNFFNRGLFDGLCDTNAKDQQFQSMTGLMKTDVIEKDNCYQLEAELPGFNKEDIKIDLKNDVLTISASHSENKDEKDNNGKYIRRERRSSSYQRSFRVDGLKPEDIIAQYRNGILTVSLPKKEAIPEKEEAARIEVKD